jgi:hypothetical protein
LGSLLIYFGILDNFYFVRPISENSTIKSLAAIVSLWAIVAPLSIIYLYIKYESKSHIFNIGIANICKSRDVKFYYAYLMVIFLISSGYYLISIHPSPLFIALTSSDFLHVAMKKEELLIDYNGIGIIRTISIFSAQVLFCYIWFKGRLLKFNFSDFVLILLSMVVLASSAEKGLILIPVIYIIMIEYIISNKSKYKTFCILFIVMLVLLFLVYKLFMGPEHNVLLLIFERVIIAQTIAVHLALDYYSIRNYIGFASLDNSIINLFDNHIEMRASEIFVDYYYPELKNLGAVNVNGIYIHEAYSNFGVKGIILAPVFYALSFIIIYKLIRPPNLNKVNLYRASFLVFFSADIVNLATSFNHMIFSTKTILIFIIFFLGMVLCSLAKKVH